MDRQEFNVKVEKLVAQGVEYHDACFQIANNIDEEAKKKYHEIAGLWKENANDKVAFKSSFKGLSESVKIPKGAVLIAFVNQNATQENKQPDYRLVWSWN